jgi:ubiquinone/menaquinone biosynthesis C-methylase UbiE
MANVVDQINLRTMRSTAAVQQYLSSDKLTQAEQASLDSVRDQAQDRHILDLGVGTGRTIKALREVSKNYLGIDNSHEMLAACRRRYPDVRLEHADARNLTQLSDCSVFLVMFSCNGIGMVTHADRLLIMSEVFRVLQPGGIFLFSTHNQNCTDHLLGFQFPEMKLTVNPARLLVRATRFVIDTLVRASNRYRNSKHDLRTPEYSMINDVCHDYATMLYYISLSNQRRQLKEIGFHADATAYDSAGCLILGDSTESSLAMVARKPSGSTFAA